MKTIILQVLGSLLCDGEPAQPGAAVLLYMKLDDFPSFPASISGVVQVPVSDISICDPTTGCAQPGHQYAIEYDEADLLGETETLLPGHVESVKCVSAWEDINDRVTVLEAQTIIWRRDLTGLVGGAATDLDSLSTAGTSLGERVALVSGGFAHAYILETGTDATSSPTVIRPTDYAGGTNEKVWRLIVLLDESIGAVSDGSANPGKVLKTELASGKLTVSTLAAVTALETGAIGLTDGAVVWKTSGGVASTVKNTGTTASRAILLPDAAGTIALAERTVENPSEVTGLVGGTATDLDSLPTLLTAVGRITVVTVAGIAYVYQLIAGTDAEASPSIVRPDDYAGGTNEKVWALQGVAVTSASVLDATRLNEPETIVRRGDDGVVYFGHEVFIENDGADAGVLYVYGPNLAGEVGASAENLTGIRAQTWADLSGTIAVAPATTYADDAAAALAAVNVGDLYQVTGGGFRVRMT